MLQTVAHKFSRFIDIWLLKKDSGRVAAPVKLLKCSRVDCFRVALGLNLVLASKYFFLDISRREDSKNCVASSDHQSYEIDHPESLVQSHPEVVIANSECDDRQLKYFQNRP